MSRIVQNENSKVGDIHAWYYRALLLALIVTSCRLALCLQQNFLQIYLTCFKYVGQKFATWSASRGVDWMKSACHRWRVAWPLRRYWRWCRCWRLHWRSLRLFRYSRPFVHRLKPISFKAWCRSRSPIRYLATSASSRQRRRACQPSVPSHWLRLRWRCWGWSTARSIISGESRRAGHSCSECWCIGRLWRSGHCWSAYRWRWRRMCLLRLMTLSCASLLWAHFFIRWYRWCWPRGHSPCST